MAIPAALSAAAAYLLEGAALANNQKEFADNMEQPIFKQSTEKRTKTVESNQASS